MTGLKLTVDNKVLFVDLPFLIPSIQFETLSLNSELLHGSAILNMVYDATISLISIENLEDREAFIRPIIIHILGSSMLDFGFYLSLINEDDRKEYAQYRLVEHIGYGAGNYLFRLPHEVGRIISAEKTVGGMIEQFAGGKDLAEFILTVIAYLYVDGLENASIVNHFWVSLLGTFADRVLVLAGKVLEAGLSSASILGIFNGISAVYEGAGLLYYSTIKLFIHVVMTGFWSLFL